MTITLAERLRRADRALLVVTVVAFVLRFVWFVVAHPSPVSDYLGYRSIAYRLHTLGEYTRGGLPTAWRTPGYPGFLALGMRIWESDRWLSFLNVVLSTAAVPLTWMFTRRLQLERGTRVLAAAVVACSPTLVFWAPVLGSENLQVVLLLAALVCATAPGQSTRAAVGSAVLFGTAVLVRPESMFYLLALPVLLWATGPQRWRSIATRTAAIALGAGLVIMPWYVRNEIAVGRGAGLSSTGGANFYMAHRDDGYGYVDIEATPLRGLDEPDLNRTGFRLGFEHLREEPWSLVTSASRGAVELFRTPRYAAFYGTRRTAPAPPFPISTSTRVVEAA
jgi:4-amino-4-deoxy-L-arabinose transferase-like glycosyltransferase